MRRAARLLRQQNLRRERRRRTEHDDSAERGPDGHPVEERESHLSVHDSAAGALRICAGALYRVSQGNPHRNLQRLDPSGRIVADGQLCHIARKAAAVGGQGQRPGPQCRGQPARDRTAVLEPEIQTRLLERRFENHPEHGRRLWGRIRVGRAFRGVRRTQPERKGNGRDGAEPLRHDGESPRSRSETGRAGGRAGDPRGRRRGQSGHQRKRRDEPRMLGKPVKLERFDRPGRPEADAAGSRRP